MAEIKRTFLQGKMNKDLDERMVPDGQYTHALNIQIAKSEGSNVGALENSLGNEQKTYHGLTNARCIGTYPDHSNQLLYYFVTADQKDFVAEYDDKSQSSTMLLESSRINGKTILDFQKDKLITGIVKIVSGTPGEDLLAWTDDHTGPRITNIERAKGFGIDGFEEDDISLIKKPPIYAPNTKLTFVEQGKESNISDKFLSFAYAYRYLDGEMSALSPFTNAAFSPKKFKLDYHTVENEGMTNAFTAVDVEFNTGSKRVTDVMLVFKESNSTTVYVAETFNKKDNYWGDDEVQSFRFSNSKIYRLLGKNELFRLYDSVPRKAKALDVVGNRLAFGNYLEGYNLTDEFGETIKLDYNLSLFTKSLHGSVVERTFSMLNVENDQVTIDFSGITLDSDGRLTFGISLTEKTDGTGTFVGSVDFILNRDYVDAQDLGSDPDFIRFIEEVLTNNFMEDYSYIPPDNSELKSSTGFIIGALTASTMVITAPTLTFEIDNTPGDSTDSNFSTHISRWGYDQETGIHHRDTSTDSSCKTNRSYEVAMLYLDEYGRATTALTSVDNTIDISQKHSVSQNKIRVNVNHRPPSWAKHFRFAMKENKKEYQTIYGSFFYEDTLFRWVKLDGANKDKVSEGDTLIVKSDLDGPLEEVVKVRVLEITSKQDDFLKGNLDDQGDELIEGAGLYMKIKVGSGFNMSNVDSKHIEFSDYDKKDSVHPSVTFGPLGETDSNGVYTDFELKAGSQIDFDLYSWEYDTFGGGKNDEHSYIQTHPVNDNYDNFQFWFEQEVGGFDGTMKEYNFYRDSADKLFLQIVSLEDGTATQPSYIKGTLKMNITSWGAVFETEPDSALDDIFYEGSQTFDIIGGNHQGNILAQDVENRAIIELDFFNCYALGGGIESYRYKDALNAKYLNFDSRPTAKSESEYREIRRYADITYSDPYVESLGINGLNNFNTAKANYKDDIVKKFGSIQALIARETDLVVFQENKISKVLYGKELIVGPDGSSNLASIDHILGSQIPYVGEHGVSKNPESISVSGNQMYFTDEKGGHVCRLAQNGITIISAYGMTSYFRDQFAVTMNKAKLGAYDPYNEKYILSNSGININEELIEFSCDQTIKKQNFTGTMKAEIDFGLSTGDVGVNITTDKEIKASLVWNGVAYETIVVGVGSISFNKNDLLPRKAELIIEAGESTAFEVQGNCAIVEDLTMISIVRGAAEDDGTALSNRYKWFLGNYSSSYKIFNQELTDGITVWNKETGDQGVGHIAKTGSKVVVESYKGFGDTGNFGENDLLGYLVSNTLYTEAEIDNLIAAATMINPVAEITEGGETINRITFDYLRPFGEHYLYLIWDYSKVTSDSDAPTDPNSDPSLSAYELAAGGTANEACTNHTNGATGTFYMDDSVGASTVIYEDSTGTNYAPASFYSDGVEVREWTGSAWTGEGQVCAV